MGDANDIFCSFDLKVLGVLNFDILPISRNIWGVIALPAPPVPMLLLIKYQEDVIKMILLLFGFKLKNIIALRILSEHVDDCSYAIYGYLLSKS